MKNSSSVALLSLLLSTSAIGQAESWTRHYVVELGQDGSSPAGIFSIRSGQHTFPDTPSHLVGTKAYTEAILPPEDKPHRLGSYGVKTSFIKSISWQLIYATSVLVAYDLVMTTDDAAPGAKPYSWIPVEAFFAVGWLSGSYWNTDSPLFNPIDKPEAGQDDPFAINTMMLPANGQQQRQQREERTESSIQQASGASTFTGALTGPLSSGSGDGNEGPEQHQHTLGLDCRVSPCKGICIFRPASSRIELAEGWLNSEESSTAPAQGIPEQGSIETMSELTQILHHFQPQALTISINTFPANSRSNTCCVPDAAAAMKAGELTCKVPMHGEDDQLRPCGFFCNNRKAMRAHKTKYHTKSRLHFLEGLSSMRKSSSEKARLFIYPETHRCYETVIGEDGQQQPCHEPLPKAQSLLDHKLRYHPESQASDGTAIGDDGQRSGGIMSENAQTHQAKVHRKRKPFDADRDDHLNPPEGTE